MPPPINPQIHFIAKAMKWIGGIIGDMKNRKEHLTSEGFDKILSIKANMNEKRLQDKKIYIFFVW